MPTQEFALFVPELDVGDVDDAKVGQSVTDKYIHILSGVLSIFPDFGLSLGIGADDVKGAVKGGDAKAGAVGGGGAGGAAALVTAGRVAGPVGPENDIISDGKRQHIGCADGASHRVQECKTGIVGIFDLFVYIPAVEGFGTVLNVGNITILKASVIRHS